MAAQGLRACRRGRYVGCGSGERLAGGPAQTCPKKSLAATVQTTIWNYGSTFHSMAPRLDYYPSRATQSEFLGPGCYGMKRAACCTPEPGRRNWTYISERPKIIRLPVAGDPPRTPRAFPMMKSTENMGKSAFIKRRIP